MTVTYICNDCPRQCNLNRQLATGYCRSGLNPAIASICIHRGEEPPISGSNGLINVFFSHCNLQCVYCQNKKISHNKFDNAPVYTIEQLVNKLLTFYSEQNPMIGFVSPSHYVKQVIATVEGLRKSGINPTIVYNTNSYDTVESIRLLEPFIDVYLPDFKYSDSQLAKQLSFAGDYPEVALKAIKEMLRQKGNSLFINERGYAEKGIIVRHLVLPGYLDNTRGVLSAIAEELSPNLHISLMSQYNPRFYEGNDSNLQRFLTASEYEQATNHFHEAGLHKGWIQELDSSLNYNPDFNQDHPFETEKSPA